MRNVNLLFEGDVDDVDIICVSSYVADNIDYVLNQYFGWMHFNIDKHSYWELDRDGVKILYYETDSFIWWLNTHYSQHDEQAYIVRQHTHLVPEYPIANF